MLDFEQLIEMDSYSLKSMKDQIDVILEERALESVEKSFEDAFDHAHEEGYKVFYDDQEINFYDLYIATEV